MFSTSLLPKDIIELLSKLKDKTPAYPVDLLAARKAAFMKQATAIKLDGKGQGGGSSGSGLTGFGGLSAMEGILLQAVIGVWIIAAMLTAAYVFRDQIIDLLQQNENYVVEGTRISTEAPDVSPPPVTEIPTTETPTTEIVPATEQSDPGEQNNEEKSESIPDGDDASDNFKDKPGLRIGQDPDEPPPGQEKPKNK